MKLLTLITRCCSSGIVRNKLWAGKSVKDSRKFASSGGEYKAKVEIMDSFSGHADHSELVDYFKAMTGPKSKTWLVHGEPDRSKAFKDALGAIHDGEVTLGALGETVTF